MTPGTEATATIGGETTPRAAVVDDGRPTWIGAALGSIRHTRINLKAVRRSFKLTAASVRTVKATTDDLGFADTIAKAEYASAAVADAAAHVQAALDACDRF